MMRWPSNIPPEMPEITERIRTVTGMVLSLGITVLAIYVAVTF